MPKKTYPKHPKKREEVCLLGSELVEYMFR
ncbi:MAG: Unknown protein [uncultured Sulfurovum sp.]|uniref:Uncharacterized protein n=1 Tax=uncultured Sulfurovum sp. TaxID=269237 RepID=A0A6S6S8L2_9BACT|nr:MAG: Unknown protein [uncultured Sulfurovum sp.]